MSSVLSLKNVNKHFGQFQALTDISLSIYAGEVHCLVGENGCGKSTLIKILSGVYQPDAGTHICINGETLLHGLTPKKAKSAGIHVIWQDLSLFPALSVAENICFDWFTTFPWKKPNRKEIYTLANQALARLGLQLDVSQSVADLDIAQRQLVAIAKVLTGDAKIIFMDEPTASLTAHEVGYLLEAVRKLKSEGIAIVFVSHRLAEVQSIADRVTVIRDGKLVITQRAEGVSSSMLTEWMTGQTITEECRSCAEFSDPILTIKNWTKHNQFNDINLTLHRGEIVGITGLLGSGRTELALSLFGMNRADSGELWLENKLLHLKNNQEAIAEGIAYVSEDRLNLGLIQPQSIRDNSAIAILKNLDPSGIYLAPYYLNRHTRDWVNRLGIKAHDIDLPVSTLSGGNQQRVVLAKWLSTQPKLLILDAPTVGVDIGAKVEIFKTIKLLADSGLSV
ncbi:Ribose import ATP-binding protein RbsA [Suttonella ornithocola]|uniref:Ribose import ATP-binding protein RbsA n=1 Tax=Suttonella ornithocola TaxID=279832 RepID=A0A380MP29_9GAMM|nr:sugar ABC transporter ATP-binding protein [Suttonella ornithocola]SUO94365.1 Ribose import ATP-binding protein RbsA [Suttonella ornithocola]